MSALCLSSIHDQACRLRGKGFKVIEVVGDDLVDLSIVHIPIEVNESVSKPGHQGQVLSQVFGNETSIAQNGEALGIVVRDSMEFLGRQVVTDVQRCFDSSEQP